MPFDSTPRLSLSDRMKQRNKKPSKKEAIVLDEPSPLDTMDISGNTEKDDAQEVSLIESKLKNSKGFNADAFDMGFYIPIVFLSRAQCDAWLQQTGLASCVSANKGYVDGVAAAKILGVTLPAASLPFKKNDKPDRLAVEVGCSE